MSETANIPNRPDLDTQPKVIPGREARPSWDDYFMEVAALAAKRSTCLRRQVGAAMVSGRRVLATGYNGAPGGMAHCLDIGCIREQRNIPSGERHELCRGIHAEQNTIIQAAKYCVNVDAATLYCTHQPCTICLKMLLNLNVVRLVFRSPYPDEFALNLLAEAGFDESRAGSLTVWAKKPTD